MLLLVTTSFIREPDVANTELMRDPIPLIATMIITAITPKTRPISVVEAAFFSDKHFDTHTLNHPMTGRVTIYLLSEKRYFKDCIKTIYC